MMGVGTTQEVLAICQSEEVSVSSERGLVPRLCDVFERHPHGGQKNRGCQIVA